MSHRVALGVLIASAVAVSLLFLASMLDYTGGGLSAPLDDSFIYFQYARRLAEGHPFEYSAGAGFSTGATSVAYPVLLAGGHVVGFSGDRLIGFAFALSSLGLVASVLLAYGIVRRDYGEGAGLVAGLLIIVNGWLLWGYLSMMEVWLYGTLLLATVFFLGRASAVRWAWPVGMASAALLVFARPEAMLVGFAAALLGLITIARARLAPEGKRSNAIGHPIWALLPFAGTLVYFAIIRIGSGSFTTNGFALKSVLSDSYLSAFEKSGDIGDNFVTGAQALFDELGPAPVAAIAFGLALVGAATGIPREWERNQLGITTAASVLLLVGLAAASQGSGLGVIHARYVIALEPLAAILIIAGLWELGALVSASEAARAVAAVALIVIVAPGLLGWASDFGENSAEVYLQQREVGLWLRDNTPEDALVALNDAGAIAYYSDRPVYDLVGLVTNDQARAFREGAASVYESIERLPADERPDYFAVFPGWFPFIQEAGDDFAQLYTARLDDRRITGGDELAVYAPTYDTSDRSDTLVDTSELHIVDDIDVADLTSEDDHGYRAQPRQFGLKPAQPQVIGDKLLEKDGDIAFDGGRLVTRSERFTLTADPHTTVKLATRILFPSRFFTTDGSLMDRLEGAPYYIAVRVNGKFAGIISAAAPDDIWGERTVAIPAAFNPTGHLDIEMSVPMPWSYESYHYWLLQ